MMRGAASTARNEGDPDRDEADPEPAGERQCFAQQEIGADRVDDVTHRQQRVRDRYRDARESQDPDEHGEPVARDAHGEIPLGRHLHQGVGPGVARERQHAQHVRAGLEEELRARVEQHAGHQERHCRRGHCRLTTTRRGSRASSRIGTPCATS